MKTANKIAMYHLTREARLADLAGAGLGVHKHLLHI